MSKPAARVGDFHACPMVTPGTPPVPHAGGPVMPPGGIPVFIGGAPAARQGDMCTCVGPPDTISTGSTGVMIAGMPAARIGDLTAHGGSIVIGFPTVLIGETAAAGYSPAPPSVLDLFQVWLHNLFADDAHQREIFSDGIIIEGDEQFRAETRNALERLAATPSGGELLRQIDSSGNEVLIRETSTANGFCTPGNYSDARTPGVGTDSTVDWNPNHHTTDASDPVTGRPGSTVILGHELVHANHNANGNHHNGPSDSYGPQAGSSQRGEERATVGSGGTSIIDPSGNPQTVPDHSADSPTENSIRDDLGIPRRPTYYPSNWPGGAPW